jgi:hypothetical protein
MQIPLNDELVKATVCPTECGLKYAQLIVVPTTKLDPVAEGSIVDFPVGSRTLRKASR